MNDKLKRGFNKKIALGVLAVLLLVAFIAISSFNPFTIDPSRWQTMEFLSDELIIVSITIFAMVSFIFIGNAGNAQDPRSDLAKSRVDFSNTVKLVKDTRAFRNWCHDVLERNDMMSAKVRELGKVGIDDASVLELEVPEIKALTVTQKYGDRFYKALTKQQIKAVLRLKSRPPIRSFVDPNYYLSVKSIGGNATTSEQAGGEAPKKIALMSMSIVSKAIVTVLIAIILGSFARDLSQGVEQAEAWAKFIQRMFSLVSSSFMGYIVGCQANDIDAYYIRLRVDTMNEFLNDGSYRPKTQQEEAREEFAERVRRESVLSIPQRKDV